MTIQNKRLTGIIITVIAILLIPFIAMQFSNEVKWSAFDFAVAAALLFGVGLACEFVLRKVTNIKYRIAICAVLLIALVLLWAELAVGIFGSPIAGS